MADTHAGGVAGLYEAFATDGLNHPWTTWSQETVAGLITVTVGKPDGSREVWRNTVAAPLTFAKQP